MATKYQLIPQIRLPTGSTIDQPFSHYSCAQQSQAYHPTEP
uniref:Uncharacterized protein n=1 Tax=Arundo donax TaxID=35708 RepID=A0A0A9TYJ5_ARUDO